MICPTYRLRWRFMSSLWRIQTQTSAAVWNTWKTPALLSNGHLMVHIFFEYISSGTHALCTSPLGLARLFFRIKSHGCICCQFSSHLSAGTAWSSLAQDLHGSGRHESSIRTVPLPGTFACTASLYCGCGLSCLVGLNSDFHRLCGSLHGPDTFWARKLGPRGWVEIIKRQQQRHPGFSWDLSYHWILIVNPMGRILVRWSSHQSHVTRT